MTTESGHEIIFFANDVRVEARFTMFNHSGRLRVYAGDTLICEWEGYDYSPDYFTGAGLERAARSAIAEYVEFGSDPANFGDGEAPDAAGMKIARRAMSVAV